jgi:5-(carboxyamino)imidazole ribonucleotide mutase
MNEPLAKGPCVVILMGSKADRAHAQKVAEAARALGLQVVMRIGSAHKTPEHVLALVHEYEADPRATVYITVAGRSNALSGFVDGAVTAPVIACPPPSDAFGGMDVLSSLRMPSAIACAVVLDPANAALLAAKILGLTNSEVRARVSAFQKDQARKILDDDKTEQANDK